MTIVMRNNPTFGDATQDSNPQQQQQQQQQQPPPPPAQTGQPPPASQAGGTPNTSPQLDVTPPQQAGDVNIPDNTPNLETLLQPSEPPAVSEAPVVTADDCKEVVQAQETEMMDTTENMDIQEDVNEEPGFPMAELARLDEMINRPRWVIPVLPQAELETLVDAAILLSKLGSDVQNEACQRFYREGLTVSFTKILMDEAVSGWKADIQKYILHNAEKLVDLCVIKLPLDCLPLIDVLAMVFNPHCRFHTFNSTRQSEALQALANNNQLTEEHVFARSPDARAPKGWMVDLIQRFGTMSGFDIVLERFSREPPLNVPLVASLLKPFGLCAEYLTTAVIKKFFMPVVDIVPKFLDKLTDEELKKESKSETKNDALSSIIKAMKHLVSRLPDHDATLKDLEIFRLKMILRLLRISSFNGKMNALNEVNKVITNVYQASRHVTMSDDPWLTADKLAEWIREHNVLSIVLSDSLHQPQYTEKLDKIVRFMIKEKVLTMQDLDRLWEAQSGKHDAIVKNIHDLLAKLAWDFSPDQLDHLFECFQGSWHTASKKQREKLLELMRRLAEDDKEGIMANKVLTLLWNLARSDEVPTEIMDQALNAHVKILDYSCTQDRDAQKVHWIGRFLEELKNDQWVLPALKQIREICQLFPEAPNNYLAQQRVSHPYYRNNVIDQLQSDHSIISLVSHNLAAYMARAKQYSLDHPEEDPANIIPDGRFPHLVQVQERLRFLRFLLKDGQLWLCEPQAREIWQSLAEKAIYVCDREACFKWFAKLMGEEPDLDPQITRDFFERNILQLDASLLTENGINCFERFFKHVNLKENKLQARRHGGCFMDDTDLIGLEYVWRVVLLAPDEVAIKAVVLLKTVFTNLGPRLRQSQLAIHQDFISSCYDRLKALYDTVTVLQKDPAYADRVQQETVRMVRVLNVLREYVAECDEAYEEERLVLPLSRAFRGRLVTLKVRYQVQPRQVEDFEVWSHENETLGAVRRQILQHIVKGHSNYKVDLYVDNEYLDPGEDKKLILDTLLHDKATINAKLVASINNRAGSPDSSSDSSVGSPHNPQHAARVKAEHCLPGVIMSQSAQYTVFLTQLSDLGSELQLPRLRDGARALLKLMPADQHTVQKLKSMCGAEERGEGAVGTGLEEMFFNTSPSQVLYNLEVCYSLLMPALQPLADEAFDFQFNFVRSGGVQLALNMVTKGDFLTNADLCTRRAAYLTGLRVVKLMVTTVAYAKVQVVVDACSAHPKVTTKVTSKEHQSAAALQKALHNIPVPESEYTLRGVASRLGQHMGQQATPVTPDLSTVKALQKIAWAASSCSLHLMHASIDDLHNAVQQQSHKLPDCFEDIMVGREALETLAVCLAVFPAGLDVLHRDKAWQTFIIDLLLVCNSSSSIRQSASEQFFLMAVKCINNSVPVIFLVTLLFTVLQTTAKEYAQQSHHYFMLLCWLLNHAAMSGITLPTAETLLTNQLAWLKNVRDETLQAGEVQVEEQLLEGHLSITRELLAFISADKKFHIGADNGGANLIKELVEDFIFPASKIVVQCRKSNGEFPAGHMVPVCSSHSTIVAAFDLLVALCTGCVQNLKFLTSMLVEMYYTDEKPIEEWDYIPPVGSRPYRGFVGLKNAGATCYMNSVIQQLFMMEPIRQGVLAVEGITDNLEEELMQEDKPESETNVDMVAVEEKKDEERGKKGEGRKDYNLGVLRQVQVIFGYLAASQLQYFIPTGFWKHFKLWDEPVNLREQHDALEFFNSLVDSMDEALKALKLPPLLEQHLGGSFADQKICKDCPHRYQREEGFTALNIDIHHHQNLFESLEQYVKGDLLEGANAYHCEKCDRKVDTVKRLVIRKLPQILAIQLKRFDYDWERECAIKFNDYFEFPREFDMEPYTVQGLEKIEGEIIDDELGSSKPACTSTKYRLVGVVVHSGQASGGHYYSYILHRAEGSANHKWYKFDDGEVCECNMDDNEEMKNQCFGGEYVGEVYDHMLKRQTLRRQKRWWNAYILFYEQIQDPTTDLVQQMEKVTVGETSTSQTKLPQAIERCVRRQNVMFMHERNQFSVEYFGFMKKLLSCNNPFITRALQDTMTPDIEAISLTCLQLGCKFLFSNGLRTKKSFRGLAMEWYDALQIHIRTTAAVRSWMAHSVLFAHPSRFTEYLLESPSTEVRNIFAKVLVLLAHLCSQDGPCPPPLVHNVYMTQPSDGGGTLGDHILNAVLGLLRREVSEHGRHLQQYFHLFLLYCNHGLREKKQLLQLNVPQLLMLTSLDEGPGPPIRYQNPDLTKLHCVVSQLLRCCDVSSRCVSFETNQAPTGRNPHRDVSIPQPLMSLQPAIEDILLNRTGYVKKLIEDYNNLEDTHKLLRFCSWENPHFSSTVLIELLWQVAYCQTYELRPVLDLLLQMLLIEDSWQRHRIHNTFQGIGEDREGLFDTIERCRHNYPKRAYQCIKMMVNLFSTCVAASRMIQSHNEVRRKWSLAVYWLNDELERRNYQGSSQYQYNNWSSVAASNENSSGHYLERSQSALLVMNKAYEFCPDEEQEEEEEAEEENGGDHDVSVHNSAARTQPSPPSTTQQPPPPQQQPPQQQQEQQQTPETSPPNNTDQPSPQHSSNQNGARESPNSSSTEVKNNEVPTQPSQPAQPPANQINNQLKHDQDQESGQGQGTGSEVNESNEGESSVE